MINRINGHAVFVFLVGVPTFAVEKFPKLHNYLYEEAGAQTDKLFIVVYYAYLHPDLKFKFYMTCNPIVAQQG